MRLDKVHVLQRLRQARALCEAQWAEAGTTLSSALREETRCAGCVCSRPSLRGPFCYRSVRVGCGVFAMRKQCTSSPFGQKLIPFQEESINLATRKRQHRLAQSTAESLRDAPTSKPRGLWQLFLFSPPSRHAEIDIVIFPLVLVCVLTAILTRGWCRLHSMLQKETLERRRQEDRATRLRGALRHLLAEGENIDCADTGPESNGTRKEPSYRSSSAGTPDQVLRDGLTFGRSAVTMTQQPRNSAEGAVDFLPP